MATTTSVIFPNTVYTVYNDTLASFISATTVSPSVPGTFAFFKNNSSGAALTSSSIYDTVGNFAIFCTFTPTDSVTYQTSSNTALLVVQDKDLYNSRFDIPVTDTSNVLVNGNFQYLPARIASGTSSQDWSNIPGWNFVYGNNFYTIYNNVDLSSGIAFPYPFGTRCIKMMGGALCQSFYCVAGTYTLSFYGAAPVLIPSSNYGAINIDGTRVYNVNLSLQLTTTWQLCTTNFTISTTGMHRISIGYTGGNTFYLGNFVITPVSTQTYLKPSKIMSLISNGVFETEVQTANSKSLTPLTNWTTLYNAWVLNNYSTFNPKIPTPYPSGNQCVALEALGTITQTFTATASSSNFLSFYVCSFSDISVNQIRASINSTVICDVSSTIFQSSAWTKMIYGGITTVDGTNTLTIQGRYPVNGWIAAIDNVVFGQVSKEAPVVSFGPKTDYPFIPIQNSVVNSNKFTANSNGALSGLYEFTASSSAVFTNSNTYYLADNDPNTYYHSSFNLGGTPIYYRAPYASNGTYQGATDATGNLTYFWTTNIVGVGTISGEWVQYKLPYPIQLTKYGLLGRNGFNERFPLDYYIIGSTDGITWYSIKSVTNSQIPTWPNTQFVDLSNNTKLYSFYRLVCSRVGITGGILNFSQFSLYGDNTKNYYGTPIGANLNASFDISGAYTYYLDASLNNQIYPATTLPVGNQTIYTRYISNDTVDYNTSYQNTTLSTVMPPAYIIFPQNIINVVYNETLANFVSKISVYPNVPGTFTLMKVDNTDPSIRTVVTSASTYGTAGKYTLYVSFAPDDYINNQSCYGTYTLNVEDQDAYNNYFNIPVTDLSNVLVNGNFTYNQYASGTQTANALLPGWFFAYSNTAYFYNNFNFSASATFPPPFGTCCVRLGNGYLQQVFYAIAGTYTFSLTYCNLVSLPTQRLVVIVDGITQSTTYLGTINNWQDLSFNFSIASTGMHLLGVTTTSNSLLTCFGNVKIVPVSVANQISYLKFSKINSLVFNGTFETEIRTPNSKTLTPLTYWTSTNSVYVLNNYTAVSGFCPIPYPSGNQCITLDGNGKITQTFTGVDSSLNYLSLYLSNPSIFDASKNPVTVKMNDTTIATIVDKFYPKVWTKFLFTNIATVAGTNTISIEGTGALSAGTSTAIDNVIFGSMNMSPTTTTYAPTTTIVKYGSPMSSIMTATCDIPATFTYYLDSALSNQIFADSTLPVGNYQIYVKAVPLDIYNYINSFAGPASISVVNPNPIIQFPKIINVVYNDTLANLINYTTVVPATAGTLTFRLNNSSGVVLTTSSVYNVVGKFTVFCTFTPDDTATYESSSATYSVTVEDNDAPNNYFNIPVTDTTNLLVNGNFEYIPATYPPGTVTSNQIAATATNIPGWRFWTLHTSNYSGFVNDVSVSAVITYPFPNGPKCVRLRGGIIYQSVFLNAGTYTFSCYVARSVYQAINSYFQIFYKNTSNNVSKQFSVWNNTLQAITDWYYYSTTFTVSTTTTYEIRIVGAGSPTWYFQKMSIVPTYPNPQYLKFSKIDSQIFNGSFESEVKTANSISTVSLSNWNKENTVWVLNNYSSYNSIPVPYPSGNQCVAIEKTGKISQTFTYTASNLNYLSFYVCGDASSNPLTVKLNDVSVCTISPCSSAGGTWQKYIYPYLTTIDGTNTLSFEGTNQTIGYLGIDNVIMGQVNRASTTVTFPTPAPIMYSTDLSAVLVATGSQPGSIQYFTDSSYNTAVFSNTLLIPSMYTIYAVFTPSDQVNYMQAFASVDLSVNKLIPSLTYGTLPAINYGTLLESSLIATTNVPSKIEYYLDENLIFQVNGLTVLTPGNYTLYARLTPTDTVTYSPIVTSTSLTVNPSIIQPTMFYPPAAAITYGTNLTNKLNASIVPNLPGTIRYYINNQEVTTYTVLQPGIWTITSVFTPEDSTFCNSATASTSIFVSNMSIETRKLVLNTADILASTNADDYFGLTVSNAIGMVENSRYTYTWNINIRSIMGDEFYNRYTKFSIRLKEFVNGDLFTTAQPASQNLSVHYEILNECKLSGLQFDPAPRVNGVTSDQASICILTRKFPASSPSYYNMLNGVGGAYTFSKTTDVVPIKIDLPNLYDNQYFAPSVNAVLFGHLSFVFEIRGILN